MPPDPKLSGLARRLVLDGLIEETAALEAQENAKKEKTSFTQYIVGKKVISAHKIAMIASNEFGLPLLDLNSIDPATIPRDLVKDALIKKHQAIPLHKRGNRLYVAIAEPTNLVAIDEIKFHTGVNTEAVLVEVDKLTAFIEKLQESEEDNMSEMLSEDLEDLDFEDTEAKEKECEESGADDTPVVRFVNKVLCFQ